MPGKAFDQGRAQLLRRHTEGILPYVPETEEIKALWRDVQLHWIKTVPGYRDEVRQQISEKQKRIRYLDKKREMG